MNESLARKPEDALAGNADSLTKQLLVLAAVSHFWHLTTPSYARHQAFGELYPLAHDLADKLNEALQGAGVREPDQTRITVGFTGESGAEGEIEKVVMAARKISESKALWVSNIGQEIEAALFGVLYKLKKLS